MNRTVTALAVLGTLAVLALSQQTTSDAHGRRNLNLPGRKDDLPFSHAVLSGDTLYISGTLGIDAATGKPPAEVEQEIRLLLDDVKKKLALADMSMDDLVSVQVFCPDLTLYDTFNTVYRGYFTKDFPARSFLGSGPLLRGARFELNGVAVRR